MWERSHWGVGEVCALTGVLTGPGVGQGRAYGLSGRTCRCISGAARHLADWGS
jgi:hypothetical protein